MAQNATAGFGVYAKYGYEATFGAGATSARVFGQNQKITPQSKNNLERLYNLGSRNPSTIAAKKFEGSLQVEFELANASFLRAALGAVADGGAGPYTHTYTETNTLPSFAIDSGSELGTDDEVTEYKGCVVNTCTINASVGEIVKVTLDCPFQTLTTATSGIGSATAETFEAMTFAHGSVQLPSSTTLALVQSVELTIVNNIEMLFGLGSRVAAAFVAKTREYNLKMSLFFTDESSVFTKFLGSSSAPTTANAPAETASMILTFTNGLSSTSERSMVVTLANISFDSHTLPKTPDEVIKEDVEGWARSCTSVVWTNNTASDSATP